MRERAAACERVAQNVSDGLRRGFLWKVDRRHTIRNAFRLRVSEIRQHNHGKVVIYIARNLCLETLPLSLMLNDAAAFLDFDEPSVAVLAVIRLSIAQRRLGPHLLQSGSL